MFGTDTALEIGMAHNKTYKGENRMTYRIWATSNGTMGYREAWLKTKDGIYETDNKEEADTEAARLNRTMNEGPSFGSFSYTVKEYGDNPTPIRKENRKMTKKELQAMTVPQLREMKKQTKADGSMSKMTKADLVTAVWEKINTAPTPAPAPAVVKDPEGKKVNKADKIRLAFSAKTEWTQDDLTVYTGFDKKNLSVALAILRNPSRTKDLLVVSYDRASKTYSLVEKD